MEMTAQRPNGRGYQTHKGTTGCLSGKITVLATMPIWYCGAAARGSGARWRRPVSNSSTKKTAATRVCGYAIVSGRIRIKIIISFILCGSNQSLPLMPAYKWLFSTPRILLALNSSTRTTADRACACVSVHKESNGRVRAIRGWKIKIGSKRLSKNGHEARHRLGSPIWQNEPKMMWPIAVINIEPSGVRHNDPNRRWSLRSI